MPETVETDEQAQREQAEAERCPVEMGTGMRLRCGRPLYPTPPGVDEVPVCLMHSRDLNKDKEAFQQEIELILEVAGESVADFTRFVFPITNYSRRVFRAACTFSLATFTQRADFSGATFTQRAFFSGATFTQRAFFSVAIFTQKANFSGAKFAQGADFRGATFTEWADFNWATFTQRPNFFRAKFAQGADFREATFIPEAVFREVTFQQEADFSSAKLKGFADFRSAQFLSGVRFRETEFRNDGNMVGAVFSLARFEKPERVEFYQTYLGQALFHNCDVSKFVFSNVEWRKRPGNQKRMVFEEVVSLDNPEAEALSPAEGSADERNYGLIAELYQQLKKNFDDRRDYWTAGDFHWGEMEVKRLSSRHGGWRRWLHRNFGLAAWYKYASEYGEDYVRPLELLIAVLLLFTVAYPLAGLERAGGESGSVVSWAKMGQFFAERNYA